MIAFAFHPGNVDWFLLPVSLVAAVLFHAGTNLVSEYFDYKKGVDRVDTFGSSRILVEELLSPKSVLIGGYVAFGIGFLLGLILVYFRGTPMLVIGIAGLLGGIFYTGNPIGYKYIALGDLLVFSLMGPLMVIGSYLALTGDYNTNVLLISLPVGFLVAAILHANNIRDIMHDTQAKVKTLANVFGLSAAKIEYYFLVLGAYISVILMVVFGILGWPSLIVLISLPPAIANMKLISKAEKDKPQDIAMADVKTAQHHMLFGLLLAIGLLIEGFIK
jgi:1,4-dihydroxy-2-naphthoate octaprenyltransferase